MFAGALRCGSSTFKNKSRIMCDLHFSQIMNMSTVADTLIPLSSNGLVTVHKTVLSQPLGPGRHIMPFPFRLVDGPLVAPTHDPTNRFHPDNYTSHGRKLCLRNEISQDLSDFLYSGNLRTHYTDQQIGTIRDILIYWISGGAIVNCVNQWNANLYTQFYSSCRTGLSLYWKGYNTMIGAYNNVVVGQLFRFEVAKLPIFYQAMLQNVEISNYTYLNAPTVNTVPNAFLDTITKSFRLVNDQDRATYIQTGNATWATPLIMMGGKEQGSNTSYKLFSRPPPSDIDSNFVSAPARCQI